MNDFGRYEHSESSENYEEIYEEIYVEEEVEEDDTNNVNLT